MTVDPVLPTSPPPLAAEPAPARSETGPARPRRKHPNWTPEEAREMGRRGGRKPDHGMNFLDHPGQPVPRRVQVLLERLTPEKVAELKVLIEERGAQWLLPADEALILQTARTLVIADQLWSYMLQRGAIDTHGRPRGATRLWTQLQNSLRSQLSALGLSPLARSELGANMASSKLDLAQAMRYVRSRGDRAPDATPTDAKQLGDGKE